MELGSQVCKPVGPSCSECPLRTGCKAYAEVCLVQSDLVLTDRIDNDAFIARSIRVGRMFALRPNTGQLGARYDTHCHNLSYEEREEGLKNRR